MSKELIVSVNGREKKIAVIENGEVTEFYIERGEGSEGIVGNIYKGRVMRVLPGMQSAFVDIGLERDAFLYVSDFFDEEEEFERIVIDKTKGQASAPDVLVVKDSDAVERTEQEHLGRGSRSRSNHTAESASPLPLHSSSEPIISVVDAKRAGASRENTNSILPTNNETPPAVSRNIPTETTPDDRRRGRRGRGGQRQDRPHTTSANYQTGQPAQTVEPAPIAALDEGVGDVSSAYSSSHGAGSFTEPSIETSFVARDSSFQRIIDAEEEMAEAGSMLKDAMLQEHLSDQIRAIEFDLEETQAAVIGSLLSAADELATSSFHRIDDSDVTSSQNYQETSPVQETVAAHIARFVDEVERQDEASYVGSGSRATSSFERISDEEKAEGTQGKATTFTEEASPLAPSAPASPTNSQRGRRGGGGGGGGGGGRARRPTEDATDAAEIAVAAVEQHAAGVSTTEDSESQPAEKESPKTKRNSRSRQSAAGGDTKDASAAVEAKAPTSRGAGRSRRTSSANTLDTTATDMATEIAAPDAAPASFGVPGEDLANEDQFTAGTSGEERHEPDTADEGGLFEDAEANITAPRTRSDFARRGGRRRRRPVTGNDGNNNNNGTPQVGVAGDEEHVANGIGDDDDAADALEIPIEAVAAVVLAADTTGGAPDDEQQRPALAGNNGGRSANGGGGNSSTGGGRQSGGGRERRDHRPPQPAITDLLREGQEILVQIAKEPISQKGARITSHIALPGRFLVYMPTIEHVGVSRKIESDAERVRLRKLIQNIRKEEDVPSGGFIVRTAGVSIPEEELREDARYLVRTWRDIRRTAERAKAPALAHRDLDLVQRILRDQLSEDFAAIRVDSEEEYLQIVEFVNRVQPRLVKRVKLYTREEPILEAYGVQLEIDKAIKPRVWLRSGGYLVINQTEALVAIDVNTGKFVGRGGNRLEDTITKTNVEAVEEIARQIRLRDLGGIIVLDLIDMEERRNRHRVMQALQEALQYDKSPTKVLSFNDFGLVIMTRKRVKQSLERTLCAPCPYCQGSGLVKSPQTVCYEILVEARQLARGMSGDVIKQTTLRVHPEVARALRSTERDVLTEIEDFLGAVDVTSEDHTHQEQFDFAFV